MNPSEVNLPEVHAELRAVFERYEAALLRNDVPALNAFFWAHPQTVRYGVVEHSLGIAAVRAARAAMAAVPTGRQLHNTVITTFGRDCGSVCTEFHNPGSALIGRQTQTWVRFDDWCIVAAHVSTVEPAALTRF